MRKILIVLWVLLAISIVISGCVDPYDVSKPDATATATLTPTPQATATEKVINVDPVKLLSAPSWTWSSRIRIKDVGMSDDGEYIAGVSTQKVIVKTPTKNLLTNLRWSNANHVEVSSDGNYIVVGDKDFFNMYDNDGGELYSYTVGGAINHMGLLDDGVVIQGGEKAPVLNAVDTFGNEMWEWKSGVSTTKVVIFEYSANAENILVGTTDDRVYYMSSNGKYLWYKSFSGNVEDIEVSDDGNYLYVLTDDNMIHSFDRYGNKNWEKILDTNTVEIEICKNGNYILTKPFSEAQTYSFQHKVYLLENNGNVTWMKQMSTDVGVIGISEDAKYVFIGEERDLRMYNIAGDELASYHLDDQFGTKFISFDMTPDVTKLAVGTTNSLLVFG
ncbi:MAG: PQQ-binding-like beta-propeller repeat protein [Methanosarcinales archaeon]|nr:PQQ-binding-like beta-propeller repeat protein [Methanosarcinales archaeon]